MSIFNWIKNLFAPAKQETLVLTDVVEKKAAPAKKKAAPKKAAANKTPAKKGRPKKTSK
jgi:hypothetical protein